MGVCGYSLAGEPSVGDFGGEIAVDFAFLKKLEADLLGGGGCGGEGGEPLEGAGEEKRGWVVEAEEGWGERQFLGKVCGERTE
jgi:hypothetical protein